MKEIFKGAGLEISIWQIIFHVSDRSSTIQEFNEQFFGKMGGIYKHVTI